MKSQNKIADWEYGGGDGKEGWQEAGLFEDKVRCKETDVRACEKITRSDCFHTPSRTSPTSRRQEIGRLPSDAATREGCQPMASSEGTDASLTTAAAEGASASETRSTAAPSRSRSGSGASGTTPATLDEAGIRCECLMNARYHSAREAFLDTVHRWFMFSVIVLGAAAMIDVLPREFHGVNLAMPTKEVFAALVAAIAALDLTFDLSNRARTHAQMKRRYFELAADLAEGERSLPESQACLNRFSADEEPAYHALLTASWNAAQEMVYGDEAHQCDVPRWHLALKNFIRFGSSRYPLKTVR